MNEQQTSNLGDEYDQTVRRFTGLPDTVTAGPATIPTLTPVVNLAATWIVQTVRRSERNEDNIIVSSGDIIFLQYIGSGNQSMRIVIPPKVADAIARQRDALGAKNKRRAARATMQRRKAAGEDLGAALRDPKVRKSARAARKANAAKRAAKAAQAVRS